MKRIMSIAVCLFCLSLADGATAAQSGRGLTVDLSEPGVDITTGFNGADITLFGTKDGPGQIAITIRGPENTMVTRRKSQIFGLWMNSESVKFRDVPVYYDIALSDAPETIAAPSVLQEYGIGLDSLRLTPAGHESTETAGRFREALVRNRQVEGHLPMKPRSIVFLNENFFRTTFYVPDNVPTGNYVIRTFLFRNGKVADMRETQLRVAQTGASARMYEFAQTNGFAYGIMAVLMALLAGGGAHVFLRRD